MADLQQYKCPCCGGYIQFDSTAQKMKCPYCDTEFEMETLQSYDEALTTTEPDSMEWNQSSGEEISEQDGLSIFVCKSCAGEIVADATLAASKCPYCNNPITLTGRLSGDLKPEGIIPFKLDKNAAKAALTKHLTGKRFLPRVFKDQNHIDEIKGVYVPFWLFDTGANAGIRYKATRVETRTEGDWRVTETKHYLVIRNGEMAFDYVPVDGTSKVENDLTESIEPYNYSDLTGFQSAYLSGYMADRYDVKGEECKKRANERIRESVISTFRETVNGYSSVTTEDSNISLVDGKMKYVLLPMWIINTTWNDKKYIFAMNGQTGKFVGDLPADKSIARKYFFGVWAAVSVVVFALSMLF